jgi:hypothetical protein
MGKSDKPLANDNLPVQDKTCRKNFTMPTSDAALIGEAQSRARKHDVSLLECEVIRVGLVALRDIPDKHFLHAMKEVQKRKLKRGRKDVKRDKG